MASQTKPKVKAKPKVAPKAKAKPAPAKPAAPKPAAPPVSSGTAGLGSPGVVSAADQEAYGASAPQIAAAARQKYGGTATGLRDQRTDLGRHDRSIDDVYAAYAKTIGDTAAANRASSAAAVGSLRGGTDASQAQAQAAVGAIGQGGADAAATRGAPNASLAEALKMAGDGVHAGQELADVQSNALLSQGKAQDDRLARLGAIAGGERAGAHDDVRRGYEKIGTAETDLAGQAADFKLGQFADLNAQNDRNEIAMATLDVKNRDSIRDRLTAKDTLKSNQAIAGAKITSAESIAAGKNATSKEIAAMTAGDRRDYYAAQKAHWERADATAATKATRDKAGRVVYPMTRIDGATVNLTEAERKRWSSVRSNLDSVNGQLRNKLALEGNRDAAVKKVMADNHLPRAVVDALADYVQKGHIGPTGYAKIASIMPGGIVPPGLWRAATDQQKAQMGARKG